MPKVTSTGRARHQLFPQFQIVVFLRSVSLGPRCSRAPRRMGLSSSGVILKVGIGSPLRYALWCCCFLPVFCASTPSAWLRANCKSLGRVHPFSSESQLRSLHLDNNDLPGMCTVRRRSFFLGEVNGFGGGGESCASASCPA